MNQQSPYYTLLMRSFLVIAATALMVVVCYFYVDRPVAFFVHRDGVNHHALFKWLTYPPPLVQSWSPLLLVLLMIRRGFGPFRPWQHTLVIACVSLVVADVFRSSIGDISGRYWPETWFGNPSLIGNGAYGFHPNFGEGDDGSFPSGHSARIGGFLGVWWLMAPRGRVLYAIIGLPMLLSLIAMDYHFVSDVIAGSVLGGIIATYAVCLATTESCECQICR
ncbi:MAG: phosphatase PAP2 family protein [Planctomycetota bacterium]|nr:phosphatase PAP2 family protein [Planctomycetota bacterium]